MSFLSIGPDYISNTSWESGLSGLLRFKNLDGTSKNKHVFLLTTNRCGGVLEPIKGFNDTVAVATTYGAVEFPQLTVTAVNLHLCYCNRFFSKCKVEAGKDLIDFSIDLGIIKVEGPIAPDFSSVEKKNAEQSFSILWEFSIPMYSLPSRLGYFEGGCGRNAKPPWGTAEMLQTASTFGTQGSTAKEMTFFFHGANGGGVFQMCYCNRKLECTRPEHFNVPLNQIEIVGEIFSTSFSALRCHKIYAFISSHGKSHSILV